MNSTALRNWPNGMPEFPIFRDFNPDSWPTEIVNRIAEILAMRRQSAIGSSSTAFPYDLSAYLTELVRHADGPQAISVLAGGPLHQFYRHGVLTPDYALTLLFRNRGSMVIFLFAHPHASGGLYLSSSTVRAQIISDLVSGSLLVLHLAPVANLRTGTAPQDSDIELGEMQSWYLAPVTNLDSSGGSHGPEDGGIQSGTTPSSDPLGRLLAMLEEPMFLVNVQGAFSIVAFNMSNVSSPAAHVVLYTLVFIYVLGILSALGGRVSGSPAMRLAGLAAAGVGFLLTMALLLICNEDQPTRDGSPAVKAPSLYSINGPH